MSTRSITFGLPRWLLVYRLGTPVLLIALALGLAAGGSVYLALRAAREQAATEVLPVLVAAADIAPGTLLGPASADRLLTVVREPASSVSEDAVTSLAAVQDRVVAAPLRRGERLLARHLAVPTASGGVTLAVPAGFVATVLPVNEQVSVGGAIGPGDRVDLIANVPIRQRDGSQQLVTQALLRDVGVLATGGQTAPPRAPYATLTLAVSPQDALVVQHLLSANVRMVLALRRPGDPVAETQPVTMETIAERFRLGSAP